MKKNILRIITGVVAVLMIVSCATQQTCFSDELAAGAEWYDPLSNMTFVWIPKGCFQMGSPKTEEGRDDDEGPVHEVCVDGFWMGKYEVTNAQYRQWKRNHDSGDFTLGDFRGPSLNGDNHPVVRVSWDDVKAFTDWLTKQSGGKYTFRLPTEAEWEYAAGAGTTTSRYWGDNPDDACRYANAHDQTSKQAFKALTFAGPHHECDDGYAVTAPVGSFRPNNFGLYDMLGNVLEWCQDWYKSWHYTTSPRDNPQGPASGSYRVHRGSWWVNIARYCRSANRNYWSPDGRHIGIGFRLVRTP